MTTRRSGSYGRRVNTRSAAWLSFTGFQGQRFTKLQIVPESRNLSRERAPMIVIEASNMGRSDDFAVGSWQVRHPPRGEAQAASQALQQVLPGSCTLVFPRTKHNTVLSSFFARLPTSAPTLSSMLIQTTVKSSRGPSACFREYLLRARDRTEVHARQAAPDQRESRTGHSHYHGDVASERDLSGP